MTYGSILVPIDENPAAAGSLEAAIRLAGALGAHLEGLAIVPPLGGAAAASPAAERGGAHEEGVRARQEGGPGRHQALRGARREGGRGLGRGARHRGRRGGDPRDPRPHRRPGRAARCPARTTSASSAGTRWRPPSCRSGAPSSSSRRRDFRRGSRARCWWPGTEAARRRARCRTRCRFSRAPSRSSSSRPARPATRARCTARRPRCATSRGTASRPRRCTRPPRTTGSGDTILARARKVGADLVVMGAYGRPRFAELVLGRRDAGRPARTAASRS